MEEFIFEQPVAYKVLTSAIKSNRFSHAYLIETNNYTKKDKFILSFIKYVVCPSHHLKSENCLQCQKIDTHNHTEVKYIYPDGLNIKKEQLISLKKEMSFKSLDGQIKVYIINEADKLNDSAANVLLKFLEEPEPNIIAIIIAENAYSVKDTIVSRCQIVSLRGGTNTQKGDKGLDAIYSAIEKNHSGSIDKKIYDIEEIVNNAFAFVEKYERNHLDMILFNNSVFKNYLKDKELLLDILDLIILIYKDALNLIGNTKLEFFSSKKNEVEIIALNNGQFKICEKINIIIETKIKIINNANTALVLDKLILSLEGAR